jgi:hypothetical protein
MIKAFLAPQLPVYAILLDSIGNYYDGAHFVPIGNAVWADCAIPLPEYLAGIYQAAMPMAPADSYSYVVYEQVGEIPSKDDPLRGNGWLAWNGRAEVVPAEQDSVSALPTADEIADAMLLRDWTAITGTVPDRSTLNALRFMRNKWIAEGSILTVYQEDDSTPAWTAALTANAMATPIVGVQPNTEGPGDPIPT